MDQIITGVNNKDLLGCTYSQITHILSTMPLPITLRLKNPTNRRIKNCKSEKIKNVKKSKNAQKLKNLENSGNRSIMSSYGRFASGFGSFGLNPFHGFHIGPHCKLENKSYSNELELGQMGQSPEYSGNTMNDEIRRRVKRVSRKRKRSDSDDSSHSKSSEESVDTVSTPIRQLMIASFSPENMPSTTVLSSSSDEDEEIENVQNQRISRSPPERQIRSMSPFENRLSSVPEEHAQTGWC